MAAKKAATASAPAKGKAGAKKKSAPKKEPKKGPQEKEDEEDEEKIELPEASDEDDDDEEEEEEADASEKAPRKTKANRFQKMEEQGDDSEPRGVVYLGHIPQGFYEPQMRTFFTQFGEITRIRLSRSKKNARSRGYAFIEFKEESVAKIVAETMNKYLLFEKQLVCHLVPPEKQHPQLFKNWKKRMPNWTNQRRRKERATFNDRPKVEVDGEEVPQLTQKQAARRNNKEKKLQLMLKDLGINFDVNEASQGQARLRSRSQKADLPGRTSAAPSVPPEVATSSKKRKQPPANAVVEEPPQKKGAALSPKASPKLSPKATAKAEKPLQEKDAAASPKVAPKAKAKRALTKRKAK